MTKRRLDRLEAHIARRREGSDRRCAVEKIYFSFYAICVVVCASSLISSKLGRVGVAALMMVIFCAYVAATTSVRKFCETAEDRSWEQKLGWLASVTLFCAVMTLEFSIKK